MSDPHWCPEGLEEDYKEMFGKFRANFQAAEAVDPDLSANGAAIMLTSWVLTGLCLISEAFDGIDDISIAGGLNGGYQAFTEIAQKVAVQ